MRLNVCLWPITTGIALEPDVGFRGTAEEAGAFRYWETASVRVNKVANNDAHCFTRNFSCFRNTRLV
jgi:hypothetical protein